MFIIINYLKPYGCVQMFVLDGENGLTELLMLNSNTWNRLSVCKILQIPNWIISVR